MPCFCRASREASAIHGFVKLLLDQNLSRRLLPVLEEAFPGSRHVVQLGTEQASDIAIWEYAAANDFVIATRDRDFLERSVLLGHPPKILQVRLGNCGVQAVADLFLRHRVVLGEFGVDPDKAYLLLP